MADILKFMHCGCTYSFGNDGRTSDTILGDGSDGDCVITEDTTLEARDYNFENFTICSGAKLCFCGEGVPILRARGTIVNNGEICLRNPFLSCNSSHCENGLELTISNRKNPDYTSVNSLYNELITICDCQLGGSGGSRGNASCGKHCSTGNNCSENGGSGGKTIGCNDMNGLAGGYYGTCGGQGGMGTSNAGGGGGGAGCCGSYTLISAGTNGGDAQDGIGGCGGKGASVCIPQQCAYQGRGGGGGGYGLCGGGRGGDGGNVEYTSSGGFDSNNEYAGGGGHGGDSYLGDGGRGGDGGKIIDNFTCRDCAWMNQSSRGGIGGIGGDSVYGNGGRGGDGGCAWAYYGGYGGAGGCSIYGNGGDGGNAGSGKHRFTGCTNQVTLMGGNGGDSIYGKGGSGGCAGILYCPCSSTSGNRNANNHGCGGRGMEGGDSANNCKVGLPWDGVYGLGIFTKCLCNNGTINGQGGDAGKISGTSTYGGTGTAGTNITIGYFCSMLNSGCIDVKGGKGCTCGANGTLKTIRLL